mmetsp:Transcript_30541/g.91010  ORF Transcript_30541/g.91010 Transcript_30541/m.91010 type:complete len:273 (-) Transcript_30541:56-874(-)
MLLYLFSACAWSPTPAVRRPALAARGAAAQPRLCASAAAPVLDLVGDGGVLKETVQPGLGAAPLKGATVEVHYEGRLAATGAPFDSSRSRGKPFKFTLGDGRVIGGWEVGVAAMAPGERATLTCSPQYAYGAKGIPPLIPPDSTLLFDVELLSVEQPAASGGTFAADNAGVPRTPADIQRAYEERMAAKPAAKEGLAAAVEWLKGVYIFGFFSGKEERPPWYLNPLITFPGIFVVVGLGFYLVVELGGVHRGEVAASGDDLAAFIDVESLKQ